MKQLFPAILSLLIFSTLSSQVKKNSPAFKIVGYYSLRSAMNADLKSVPFNQLTHINLFFLNPDSLGNFTQGFSLLRPFIETAHANHVKVLFSICGGGSHAYYHSLLENENREKFIAGLLRVVTENDADGIDVDIEGSDIDENYESFAVELVTAFKPYKKLVTAAIAVFYKNVLSDKALAQYDFVNIMSYDHTGPWMPSRPGPHSTYDHALADLDYFFTARKIPKEKLVLGVGFYGYGFGPTVETPVTSMNYGDILSAYPGSENTDTLSLPGGATLYYNGIPTIKRKTALALKMASGIMIWQISGDGANEKSLLKAIRTPADAGLK